VSTIKLDDGKYEFDIDDDTGLMMAARRNGEDWPAGMEQRFSNALMSALWRVRDLEAAASTASDKQDAECNCAMNPHAQTCPVTAHVRAMFAASGESAQCAAPLANPSDKQEAVLAERRIGYMAGVKAEREHCAALAQSAEQDRIDARSDASNPDLAEIREALNSEFNPMFPELQDEREKFEAWFKTSGFWNDAITWKAWQAALESRVLAERKQEPVAWRSKWKTGNQWTYSNSKPYCNPPEKFDVEPVFTHPTPDDAKLAVTEEMLSAAVNAFMNHDGTFTSSLKVAINAAIDRAMQDAEDKERCAFCGKDVATPCDVPPADVCVTAINAPQS
jgi:hypothetical protein